jgi:hypothetical protein
VATGSAEEQQIAFEDCFTRHTGVAMKLLPFFFLSLSSLGIYGVYVTWLQASEAPAEVRNAIMAFVRGFWTVVRIYIVLASSISDIYWHKFDRTRSCSAANKSGVDKMAAKQATAHDVYFDRVLSMSMFAGIRCCWQRITLFVVMLVDAAFSLGTISRA